MNRVLIFLTCVLAVCSASGLSNNKFLSYIKAQVVSNEEAQTEVLGDAKAGLQSIFDGFWEEGNLTDPTTVINCFDDDSANLTLTFIGAILKMVASENLINFPSTVKTFQSQFPQADAKCLNQNSEVVQLRQAYNVSQTPFVLLEAQVEKYILLHAKSLQQQAATGYFEFYQGQYKQVGMLLGQVFRQAVGASRRNHAIPVQAIHLSDSQTDLQNLLNGIFEFANLTDPVTVLQCFNDTTAQITLDFYGDIINDLASDNYLGLIREYQIYKTSLPQDVYNCVKNNNELKEAFDAYGFQNVNSSTLLKKYISFGVKHHFILLNDTKTIDQEIASDDYNTAGRVTGDLIQNILSTPVLEFGKLETFSKLWETMKAFIRRNL